MMTIATNVCYFGCQLVNELVVPLHKILLLALWPPEKNRTGRTLLHLPAGRREPQIRHCILLYYTVFTLDNRLYNRLYNLFGELYTDELPWRATENEFPLFQSTGLRSSAKDTTRSASAVLNAGEPIN